MQSPAKVPPSTGLGSAPSDLHTQKNQTKTFPFGSKAGPEASVNADKKLKIYRDDDEKNRNTKKKNYNHNKLLLLILPL
jgi:hypothetical protein